MAYTKTNWQDLPNTTTPINATNLNKIENELELLDGKSALTIAPTSNTSYSNTSQYQTKQIINLGVISSKGTRISLNNSNKVEFDPSVKFVKVSGTMCLNIASNGKTFGLNIVRSNNGTDKSGILMPQVVTNSYYQNVTIPPTLIPIEAGDIISLYIYFGDANTSARVETYSTFTVEEVI